VGGRGLTGIIYRESISSAMLVALRRSRRSRLGAIRAGSRPNRRPSEKRTLQKAAEGEFQVAEFDWVALQRLKALGFVEERSTAVVITAEGRRVLRTLIAKS